MTVVAGGTVRTTFFCWITLHILRHCDFPARSGTVEAALLYVVASPFCLEMAILALGTA